jgi:GH18 family chitinase
MVNGTNGIALGLGSSATQNLAEIDQTLDLLWRNDVPTSKVNLGLAFYGRGYKLKNPRCFQPGCEFDYAGDKGKYTYTEGSEKREHQCLLLYAAWLP